MKKGTKFVLSLIIVLAAAGTVFWVGWTEFSVKPGYCGVLISKTGGVDEKAIIPGVFSWKWERLIPTNSEIRIFELEPYTTSKKISGSLPSAEIYSKQIQQNPDFSYSFDFNITIRMSPEGIASLVRSANIKDDTALKTYLDSTAERAAQAAASWMLVESSSNQLFIPGATDSKAILAGINADKNFSDVQFASFTVSSSHVPDMKMYEKAKDSYNLYRSEVNSALSEQAKSEAKAIADDDRLMKRLEKLGGLLEKYPSLAQFLKDNDLNKTFQLLESNQ